MNVVRGLAVIFVCLFALAIGYESAFFARAAIITVAFALGVWNAYETQNEMPAIIGVTLATIIVTVWWMIDATIVVS